MKNLRELEKSARVLQKAGRQLEAADLFLQILRVNESWEHGLCCFEVANCFDEAGAIDKARVYYEKALSFEPENDLYLSGYASFLFERGPSSEAFEIHLRLTNLFSKLDDEERLRVANVTLRDLGEKLGMSDSQISAAVRKSPTST